MLVIRGIDVLRLIQFPNDKNKDGLAILYRYLVYAFINA